ncbi:glycosyltransferase [Weissella cibaria]|uniref:glycosyltransferase n=1 Tax=Weissella cibaria TaxID=137591 RepID=UPI001131423E|nr:glycosyltransferase [Weissella cibaria]QDG81980.1 glycosyltransferase family 4 protein [Weissella cibaria]
MKVVHVGEYVSGGIATYLRTLIETQVLDSRIDEIVLFKSAFNSESMAFASPKVTVHEYEYRRSLSGIRKLLSLWREIVKLHPDVIHLHSSFAGFLRLKCMRRTPSTKGIRIIYCAHGWAFTRKTSKLKKTIAAFVERALARGCDKIINISADEAEAAVRWRLPVSKMKTINNAIIIPEALPQKSAIKGNLRLLFVGRFDRQKGVDVLLKAAEQLPEVDFFLAGRTVVGGFEISKAKLPANVTLLGWLDTLQVNQHMLDSDAVIVPSRWEGFGLVALEAMKNCVPVIAANVGGLKNIVHDGVNGFLFESDSSDAIVTLVRSLNRSQLEELGNKAQGFVKNNFDAFDMEEKVVQLYQS